MASTAIVTQGTIFKVDIAATLTTVSNVYGFDVAEAEAAQIEVTNFASTAKEYLAGLADAGQVTINAHPDYSDAGQNQMRTVRDSGAVTPMQITLSDGALLDFSGVVLNNPISGAQDSAVDGSFTIRVSGAITVTP